MSEGPPEMQAALEGFAIKHAVKGRAGPLSMALVVTQHARTMGLPLDSDKLLTEAGGQVLGLGKSAVQAVLKRHGINRVLAKEGGRTSRGSIGKMREYVAFLNALNARAAVNLEAVESYWIDCVHAFFAGKPFTIKLDSSRCLRHIIRHVLEQAVDRQKSAPGVYYSGAVLQHLVGAKLDCALGHGKFQHHSFSTADAADNRAGDFFIGDVAIHVTTSPGEAVIERCRQNLDNGLKPMMVTMQRGMAVAEGLADNKGLSDRIDIFEIEQFVALNIYELGGFESEGRRLKVAELVGRYNEIIDDVETDPSLKIEVR
jgi:hypothetical protein